MVLRPTSRGRMADALCFVQFPHPGREHGPGPNDGLKPWARGQDEHRRKFMYAPGMWCDEPGGDGQVGEVVFWGEWEADSTVSPVEAPVGGGPRWVHRPFFEGPQNAPADVVAQNT